MTNRSVPHLSDCRLYPERPAALPIISHQTLHALLHEYGYLTIFLGVMLESLGVPLPGESLLIAGAVYAGTTHDLSILVLVPVAAAGAICGDQIGYGIGRCIGYPALKRLCGHLGLTPQRFELGRYLFHRYGGHVVFLGRFVAFLRTFVAVLAGANLMPWRTFVTWNALGGIAWTSLYGFGAFLLGDAAKRVGGPMGIALGVIGGAAAVASLVFVKRNEKRLIAEAEADMQQSASLQPRTAHPVLHSR